MSKWLLLFVGLLLFEGLAAAAPDVVRTPLAVPGIGTVHRYRIGRNVTIGVNFNLELLCIATAAGSGFTHPGYGAVQNEIRDQSQAYYSMFQTMQSALAMNDLSLRMMALPARKFSTPILSQVLNRGQILSGTFGYQTRPSEKLADFPLIGTLRSFYRESDSGRFFAQLLPEYNRITDRFVARFKAHYIGQLEDFFGVDAGQNRFNIILSPLYSGGGALYLINRQGTTTHFAIINPCLPRARILRLLYHETAHTFLMPLLQRRMSLLRRYRIYQNALNPEVDGVVRNNFYSLMNETLARVVTASMIAQYQDGAAAEQLILREKNSGWKNIDELYSLVQNQYLTQRERYPTFGDFLPVIFRYLKVKSAGESFDIGPPFRTAQPIAMAKPHPANG